MNQEQPAGRRFSGSSVYHGAVDAERRAEPFCEEIEMPAMSGLADEKGQAVMISPETDERKIRDDVFFPGEREK